MRRPNSLVRCVTDVAITPPMPASVTSSASAANTPSSVAVSRGAASASDRRSSSVCTFFDRLVRIDRVDDAAQRVPKAAGSPAVRTSTWPAKPNGDCVSGT